MRISIAVNKENYTHDMIEKTGAFNISVLTEGAPFGLFKQYGFQSGAHGGQASPAASRARKTALRTFPSMQTP